MSAEAGPTLANRKFEMNQVLVIKARGWRVKEKARWRGLETGSPDSTIDSVLPATKEAHYHLCWAVDSNPRTKAGASLLVSKHRTESAIWGSAWAPERVLVVTVVD